MAPTTIVVNANAERIATNGDPRSAVSRLVHPWQPTRQEENARHTGHGIDPQRYLTSVLAKLPTTPPDELDQFLPDVWKKEDAAESLSAENENNLGIPSKQSRAK